jgi:EAL domain-containing protein (putative c-di-GMP-specific phosphodiesterase class I)
LEELEFIMDNFGAESRSQLLKQIAAFLNKLTKCNAYYFGSGTFVILEEEDDKAKIEVYEETIRESFKGKWTVAGMELSVNYKMMHSSMPDEIWDVPGFYYANNKMRSMTPDKDHMVHVEDIDFKDSKRLAETEKVIKRAIENDYFQVYYQPIYSVEEKKIVSAEALIRLIDPEVGFVSPGEFIPIAEKNGMILQIGDMVFEKVFKFIASNDVRSMGIDYVEINLSVVQCMQRELADNVLAMMKEYGVSENMINLEITETAVADSPKTLLDNMNALGDKGISFAMDDFGTGYSNISALMSLPLDIIKFDKSIIDMASSSTQGYKVLESSVTMVKKLGNQIVAEGIEEAAQVDMMRELGIDYIQGYYFSKPLPQDDFIKFVMEFNKINKG